MTTTQHIEPLAARLAKRIAAGIMTGHDHPNTSDELLRLQCASELRRLQADVQGLTDRVHEQKGQLAEAGLQMQRLTPGREALADQAELVDLQALERALVIMGCAGPAGREECSARLASFVNSLTAAVALSAKEAQPKGAHIATAAEMRQAAAHDSSCVGAFARARP